MSKVLRRSSRVVVLSGLVALAAAGCGSDEPSQGAADSLPDITEPDLSAPVDTAPTDLPADELAGDTVVFVWTETGGCAMGGPNCARYEVSVDGTVQTFRVGAPDENTAGPAATGQVDRALVQAWRISILDEDIAALQERVGEGELTAAFDGVDVEVADPVDGIELSSVASDFDRSEPVFAAALDLAAAAAAAAPLVIEMR